MSDESNIVQYLAAAAGLVSAIGAGFAAVAAFRSAGSAEKANRTLKNNNRAELFRQASLAANRVVSTSVRVDDLGNDLKLEYQTLFSFAGQMGGGRQKMYVDGVEKKQRGIGPMQTSAREFLENLGDPHQSSSADLVRVISEFEGDLAHLERIKEKFIFDIGNVRADNHIYREKVIRD